MEVKRLYEIPGTDTAYTVEDLIGMVMAAALVLRENDRLRQELDTRGNK